VKSKTAQNLPYRFFQNFGSKRDSPLQIDCENFIMGCTVGFQAILNQRLAFTTLDENWIAHAFYLSMRSSDAMFRVQESKSNLELFYWLFIEAFCHIFLALVSNTCLNGAWNYCYVYWSDHLASFKCWSGFSFFLGLLASFVHARLILTSGKQSWRVLLVSKKL